MGDCVGMVLVDSIMQKQNKIGFQGPGRVDLLLVGRFLLLLMIVYGMPSGSAGFCCRAGWGLGNGFTVFRPGVHRLGLKIWLSSMLCLRRGCKKEW